VSPVRRQSLAWLGLGSLLGPCWLTGCATDERSLSFEYGAIGSAPGNQPGPKDNNEGGNANGEGGVSSGSQAGDATGGPVGGSGGSSSVAGSGTTGGDGGSAIVTGGSASGNAGSGVISGGTSAGIGGTTMVGGAAGSGGSGGEPFISPCGDLNQNRVDDCEETLVQNSRFDTASSSWSADANPKLLQAWDGVDARAQTGSGSLLVLNTNVVEGTGNTSLGSGQCLVAWGNQTFEFGARALMKAGQGGGKAAINVLVFGQDACSGDVIQGITPSTVSVAGAWQVVSGAARMPPAARSMLVRLVASKPFAQSSLEVLFDDVLVREKK